MSQEIFDRINSIGYDECKVYIHSIDSQSSTNGGIIILVLGEMSNKGHAWRKFTQTFFLAEQPGGYFVLNDIFRYLKEDVDDEVDESSAPSTTHHEASPAVETAPAVSMSAPAPVAEVEANHEAATPSAPMAIPEEAVVAAVPDKDIGPADPPAIEPAVTAVPPPLEDAPEEVSAPKTTSAESPLIEPSVPALPNGSASRGVTDAPVSAPALTPAAPAKPKSWASMAAASAGKSAWGAVPAPAPPVAPIPTPAAAPPAVKAPEPAPAAASSGSAPNTPRHAFYENALKVQTPHCFVKVSLDDCQNRAADDQLPNWSAENQSGGDVMDEATLKAAASRFGEVVRVEIVKSKACAFVEFKTVEAARKAIVASLSPAQGGEGGVKAGVEGGKLNFETRKEKGRASPQGSARKCAE